MKFFDLSEFGCPCCGKNNMQDDFLAKLVCARGIAQVPFIINSGCRCKAHNKSEDVKGSVTSSHLLGCAVDIHVKNSRARRFILSGLILAGFHRIGIGKTFIHVDTDSGKDANVIWLYK